MPKPDDICKGADYLVKTRKRIISAKKLVKDFVSYQYYMERVSKKHAKRELDFFKSTAASFGIAARMIAKTFLGKPIECFEAVVSEKYDVDNGGPPMTKKKWDKLVSGLLEMRGRLMDFKTHPLVTSKAGSHAFIAPVLVIDDAMNGAISMAVFGAQC